MITGDPDIAVPAALLGERGRARIVMALADGRALPASVLASEAGIAASTASEHLAKLLDAGLLAVEQHGRHRYYRVEDARVLRAVEALSELAPASPVRSLREGTRAQQLRAARLCYDHLAGRLGVALMSSLLERGALVGGDGRHHPETAEADRLSAPGHDVDYRVTPDGERFLAGELGIDVASLGRGRRPLVRYCLDWSEQRHHLAGALGAAIADRLVALSWVRRAKVARALTITPAGHEGLAETFGVRIAS
jgi:DNA-binding transcriptional ArsR family regulator